VSLFPAIATAVIVFALAALLNVASDLLKEEVRGWLEVLPRLVLRIAATRMGASQSRTACDDDWLPELLNIASVAEGRPITRFVVSMHFALSQLRASRSRPRHLDRYTLLFMFPIPMRFLWRLKARTFGARSMSGLYAR
jgi:hypothetical protein